MSDPATTEHANPRQLVDRIRRWGVDLGFQAIGISDIDLATAGDQLTAWIRQRFHGEMHYMEHHGERRSRPELLVPGTLSVISARMDYLPPEHQDPETLLDHTSKAYVSRYALGRDYHKVLRQRLRSLARRIEKEIGPHGHRVFVDSAPVLEKPLAEKAGLGWIGKHTNLISRTAGSWFFLGELYTDMHLPPDIAEESHCGSCRACLEICPTQAIVAPYRLDASRCISYLTIELHGSIPLEFRKPIGNRIYGCDDCQLCCPWNKFATPTAEGDFRPRHGLDDIELTQLFSWTRETWLQKTEGSAIRRIGYERWLRNIAVALGNAESSPEVMLALRESQDHPSELVREHVRWALEQHAASEAANANGG